MSTRTQRWTTKKTQDEWEGSLGPADVCRSESFHPEMCTVIGISRATLYRYVKETESTT